MKAGTSPTIIEGCEDFFFFFQSQVPLRHVEHFTQVGILLLCSFFLTCAVPDLSFCLMMKPIHWSGVRKTVSVEKAKDICANMQCNLPKQHMGQPMMTVTPLIWVKAMFWNLEVVSTLMQVQNFSLNLTMILRLSEKPSSYQRHTSLPQISIVSLIHLWQVGSGDTPRFLIGRAHLTQRLLSCVSEQLLSTVVQL